MSVRTLLFFVQFIILTLCVYQGNSQPTVPIEQDIEGRHAASEGEGDEECPAPSNIQVEFLPNGEAIVTWDAIPTVTAYHVVVTDDNQQVIFDNVVLGNQAHLSGLEAGQRYHVRICYDCKGGERDICSSMTFTYVIIDDVIVMMAEDPCHCEKDAEKDGFCIHSNSDYFMLTDPGIYSVKLVDSTEMTFIASSGYVKAVGNCPLSGYKMNYEKHGFLGSLLPYYNVGASKIHFHGTRFCVSGASVAKVTFCAFGANRAQAIRPQREAAAFPNPFKDVVRVSWPILEKNHDPLIDIQVFDARAQLVYRETLTSAAAQEASVSIHLGGLANGLYWLSVSGDGIPPTVHRLLKMDQ